WHRFRHWVRRDRVEGAQLVDLSLPRCGLLGDNAERSQLVPQRNLVAADAQARGGRVVEQACLFDQGAQRLQLGLAQREVRAVVQQHFGVTGGQREEHVGQRQLDALDGDVDAEVEPVATV